MAVRVAVQGRGPVRFKVCGLTTEAQVEAAAEDAAIEGEGTDSE